MMPPYTIDIDGELNHTASLRDDYINLVGLFFTREFTAS